MMDWRQLSGNIGPVLRAAWYLRRATRVGNKARVWGNPVIQNDGRLVIGERLRLVSTVARSELATGAQGTLSIGDGVFINYGCSISAQELVQIGSSGTIGTYCILMDNDFHTIEPSRRNERPASIPIILEENVWLGARVIVLKGVTIGRDSVIGAGSVVTRSIPPGCVAAGSPARVLRSVEPLPDGTFQHGGGRVDLKGQGMREQVRG